MDAMPPPVPEEPPARDWSLLPLDVLCSVFVMLGAVDVLMGAGLVRRSWLQAAKVPDVWRIVDMENHDVLLYKDEYVLRAMAKAAVDRSDGQLRVFSAKRFFTYTLMKSPSLTTLRLESCFFSTCGLRLPAAIRKTPMLELRSLELVDVEVTSLELYTVLENCPVLEVLRVRNCFEIYGYDVRLLREDHARIKTMMFECDDEYRFFP